MTRVDTQYFKLAREILEKRYGVGNYKACVRSYGCQQNVNDGEKIKGLLDSMGYGFCDNPDEAQCVIYNTCAVREGAENRVFGYVGELSHNKKHNPDMIVGLCGCMTQQEHIAKKLKQSYPHVDLVFGTHALHKLPELIYEVLSADKRVFDISCDCVDIVEDIPIIRDKVYKASLPIMYGCNNFCTYCIVPYVRGRERSRASCEILNEFKGLVDSGCKEITLLGQNVNSYGKGLEEDIDFPKLLRMLNEVSGDYKIRFMTSHPKDATKELFDAMADCDKVCRSIHLPVQSGSNRILKLMNRHYTIDEYISLINYAKEKMPDITVSTDIIVGFPGENGEDFAHTIALLDKVKFDSIFSFIYSKRVGTKAADMQDNTSYQEKSDRLTSLLLHQKELGKDRYADYVGRVFRILVDGEGRTDKGYMSGRTDGNIIVDFNADKSLEGSCVNVEITKALNWALLGKIV